MASQLHGNNYWHSHDQACFQIERSAVTSFCLLCHTKTWLAHDIISYSGTVYFIIYREQIAFTECYLLSHSCFVM